MERLVDVNVVMELTGLSRDEVYRRAAAGEIPSYRLSRRSRRFRLSELLAWIEKRRQGPREGG